MDSQPLEQLILVSDGTEAGIAEGTPDLGGLEALHPDPGLSVETGHRGPGLENIFENIFNNTKQFDSPCPCDTRHDT